MGCGLRKLRQTEDNSPGKIYSTLKRPQVETKVGVAYTYHHVDFLVGKDADGTSTLCLSSVRELPSQLQDLYQQGFILTAVHPFVHPCGPEPASVQRQLYRAVLIKVSDSWEKNPADFEPYHLKLEECMSADQIPTTEHIQGYVKKQIQDAADQGIMFVGFIQEPAGLRPHVLRHEGEPEEPSLSLHSSPSSLHGSGLTPSPSPLEEPELGDESGAENEGRNGGGEALREDVKASEGGDGGDDLSVEKSGDTLTHNNNDTAKLTDTTEKPRRLALTKSESAYHVNGACWESCAGSSPNLHLDGELCFSDIEVVQENVLYKEAFLSPLLPFETGFHGEKRSQCSQLDESAIKDSYAPQESNTVGHGLIAVPDLLVKTVDSVFVFQEGVETNTNAAAAYDAIVVEQWTIIDHLQVKTDYIPLLQSLASFGWRLTCVLPTPIIKTNSDGSLATKQIVFLQRPMLPRKKKESKKVIFKARNKSNKNSVKDAPKNKKKKDSTPTVEKEISDQKPCDGAEKSAEETKTSVNERREENQNNEADAEVQSEQKEDREEGLAGAGSGNARDEVDVEEEERSVSTAQNDEVDKQDDSSANQD
ncbi:raftlin [Garra rufa]|uniref:raftlin n=1 Tax=Garra rufa TaxID=137080 RepID=UPI003CCE80C3